jgi:hypothetical protein
LPPEIQEKVYRPDEDEEYNSSVNFFNPDSDGIEGVS